MAKARGGSGLGQVARPDPVKKGTSIGDGTKKMASMNKRKKASYKKYRGQGR